MSSDVSGESVASRFRRFGAEAAEKSALYAALARQVADDEVLWGIAAGAVEPQAALFFAAVQRVLADRPDDPLAAYYASFGGGRAPDAELANVFEEFVLANREAIGELLAERTAQSNEPLRAAQLRPAFGWAQACFGRALGLIEVGTSGGLLLHPDRYCYEYVFEDGATLESGDGPLLRCPVRGGATVRTLAPFVTKDLRISSRVGLDLNPLNPADAEARAWLRAMVWPGEVERRVRLDAALDMAERHPVRLRKGDALAILDAAVAMVTAPAVPCVFVCDTLSYFSAGSRARFAELIRELGSRQDLVLLTNEAGALDAVVHQAGRELRFSLGATDPHGGWLDWAPTQL